jgi:hypothetical protein
MMATSGGLVTVAGNASIASGSGVLTMSQNTFAASDLNRSVAVLGAGTAGATLNTVITTYTSATQVTVTPAASTTVTAQPNFRWRVLDSDHMLEPDAVILCRLWRDAGRAGDTLNVAPFVHFSDCHYQSSGVPGTKGRNYPFYS